ncbi:MAG: hypothetical protein AB1604_09945 [Euryarchaeota archaeon]
MIIICEPQCVGFEHSLFNAAMITVVNYAFKDEKILFLAEKEHIVNVKSVLDSKNIKAEYIEIKVPPRNQFDQIRFISEYILFKKVFKLADKLNSNKILFCSIRRPGIVSVKILTRKFKNINCMVILHSIIEAISKGPFEITEIPFWLRFWLSFANIENLKYLILGPSIEKELLTEIPNMEKYSASIDLPYFYQLPVDLKTFPDNKKILFGFFGVGSVRKGVDIFFKLAEEISIEKTNYKPEFILIGHLMYNKFTKICQNQVIIPSPDEPLTRKDFDNHAKNIDYALIFHNPDEYRLSATASFFDSISYLKPVIALRNPFIEYYFEKMGDIGYLCDDYEEMKNVILDLLENNPISHYNIQKDNLLIGRKELSLKKISKKFALIWGV